MNIDTIIIDYGMGNIGSIINMLKKIGYHSKPSSDISDIKKASKLILPGVGNYKYAMQNLNELGIIDTIKNKINDGTPFLGICLGMQLLSDYSEEGNVKGLGIIPGRVIRFQNINNYKIPHMGWNSVNYRKENSIFTGFKEYPVVRFYFVHSYIYNCSNKENIIGETEYGVLFTSAIKHENIFGVQFHPEKSHKYGMKLLQNFMGI